MTDSEPVPLKPVDQFNRLELICADTTISARVNDRLALQAQDGTYADGAMLLGVAASANAPVLFDAHFDNLAITQL